MEPLLVIAAAVTGTRGLLLVSKRAAPDLFDLPGGKPDPGETPLDALRREIDEELGVALTGVEPFAEVDGTADIEQRPMRHRLGDHRRGHPAVARRGASARGLRRPPDAPPPAARDRAVP